VSRATTTGDLGHMMSIPRKCMNSALYFRAESFPVGIKRLTHSNSTGDEYVKVKQRTAWVAYFDARQEQTSIMTDLTERRMVQEWMETKKYSRDEILAVVRNNRRRKIKQYTVAENSKPPLTRRQNDILLSPIPRNLTTLLTTNELMAGAQVEFYHTWCPQTQTCHSRVHILDQAFCTRDSYTGIISWEQGA
jgi:hypothetical protein